MINEDFLFYIRPSEKVSVIKIYLSSDQKLLKLLESKAFQTESITPR